MVKVGGSLGQGPATEVTHLGLNQPPVFSSYTYSECLGFESQLDPGFFSVDLFLTLLAKTSVIQLVAHDTFIVKV